jgi:hypothetical protein
LRLYDSVSSKEICEEALDDSIMEVGIHEV